MHKKCNLANCWWNLARNYTVTGKQLQRLSNCGLHVTLIKVKVENIDSREAVSDYLPFKIWVTNFFVSMCWSKRAQCWPLTRPSFSGWLLLMKATSASPVSSRSWNLWPWAIVVTPAATQHITEDLWCICRVHWMRGSRLVKLHIINNNKTTKLYKNKVSFPRGG